MWDPAHERPIVDIPEENEADALDDQDLPIHGNLPNGKEIKFTEMIFDPGDIYDDVKPEVVAEPTPPSNQPPPAPALPQVHGKDRG